MTDRPSRQPIYYGWIVVAVAMIALLSVFGIRSAPAVLIKPLEDEFVWSRSQISAAIAIGLVCTGLAAPFGGALMDRIGPRRVLTASMALIGVSVMVATRMTEFWQFVLLWGVLNGLGTGALAGLGPTITYRWFIERRGLVQGLLGAGTSAGMLLFIPLLSWMVVEFGWRTATTVAAGIAFALMPLALLFIRDRPSDVGVEPYGAGPDYVPAAVSRMWARFTAGSSALTRSGLPWPPRRAGWSMITWAITRLRFCLPERWRWLAD